MTVTNYIWDEVNDTVLMETDENGQTTAVYDHEPGPFGGLVSQRRGNQTYYYHYDGQGSTRELTDASGLVTDTYLYDAFGSLVASSGSTVNPFCYVGRLGYYDDVDLGLQYLRLRFFDPDLARFLCVESDKWTGTLNLFGYVANNPLTSVDPSGLQGQGAVGPTPPGREWQVWCRRIAITGLPLLDPKAVHCYIVCDGKTYGMNPDSLGRIEVHEDSPDERDPKTHKLLGNKRKAGTGPANMCECLHNMFKRGTKSKAGWYHESNCNSNYFMKTMFHCCNPDDDPEIDQIKPMPHGMNTCTGDIVPKWIKEWVDQCHCNKPSSK